MIINLLFLKIMEQNVFSMPKIGEKAPEFKAVTTQVKLTFPVITVKVGSFCSAIQLILHRFALQSS